MVTVQSLRIGWMIPVRTAGRVRSEASDDSLYLPTPERCNTRRMMGNVSPIELPNTIGFIELPQFEKFLETQFGGAQPRDAWFLLL